ncbi:MAG: vWA domain-containing protein, partial [Bryobacteraceae bacterium]
MGLLAPWFLAGLLALGLPVWLHLLRRRQASPREFASLMLFEPRRDSSVRQRRLRYLLLLVLRCLVLAALVIAFTRPYRDAPAVAAVGDRLVVFALDESFSMRQGDRFERARSEALRELGHLAAGQRVQVIAFASSARVLVGPSLDREQARAAIASLQPGDGRTSYAELVRALRLIAEVRRGPVLAHVFTDLQRSGMPASFRDLALPAGVEIRLHPVTAAGLDNWAVESVSVPSAVYGARKVRVQATVASFASQDARRRVQLVLDGRAVEMREAELPAGARATVEFSLPELGFGGHRGEVRIEPADAFAQDDWRAFAVQRLDPLAALFLGDARDRRSWLYFSTALEASGLGAFRLERATPEQAAPIRPGQYAFVVLSDVAGLPAALARSLSEYVETGGAVWMTLGPAAAVRGESVLPWAPLASDGQGNTEYRTVGELDASHPCLEGQGKWEGVKFYRAVATEPGDARVLAHLSDGTPLLWEKQVGAGRLLVFASTFDNIGNDLPLRAVFVPFVERTAAYLAGLDEAPGSVVVDTVLPLRGAGARGVAAEVTGPDGERLVSLGDAVAGVTLKRAGDYQVRRPGGRNLTVAAAADPRESDLRLAPEDMLAVWRAASGAGPQEQVTAVG